MEQPLLPPPATLQLFYSMQRRKWKTLKVFSFCLHTRMSVEKSWGGGILPATPAASWTTGKKSADPRLGTTGLDEIKVKRMIIQKCAALIHSLFLKGYATCIKVMNCIQRS